MNIPDDNQNINLKLFILDPLSVIIKLAIISNKQNDIKICIYNNVIYIQEPNIIQPLIRLYYKNSKSDLQYLYNPIELACQTFLSKEPKIKDLFICAQKGIDRLVNTYKSCSIICHSLYYYSSLIGNYLNTNFNQNLFKKDPFSCFYNQDIVNKLNNRWDEEKIKLILKMIDFLIKDGNAFESVKMLETFMIQVDLETNEIINKN